MLYNILFLLLRYIKFYLSSASETFFSTLYFATKSLYDTTRWHIVQQWLTLRFKFTITKVYLDIALDRSLNSFRSNIQMWSNLHHNDFKLKKIKDLAIRQLRIIHIASHFIRSSHSDFSSFYTINMPREALNNVYNHRPLRDTRWVKLLANLCASLSAWDGSPTKVREYVSRVGADVV